MLESYMVVAFCLSLGSCMTFVWDFDTLFSLSVVVQMMQTLSVNLSGLEL